MSNISWDCLDLLDLLLLLWKFEEDDLEEEEEENDLHLLLFLDLCFLLGYLFYFT